MIRFNVFIRQFGLHNVGRRMVSRKSTHSYFIPWYSTRIVNISYLIKNYTFCVTNVALGSLFYYENMISHQQFCSFSVLTFSSTKIELRYIFQIWAKFNCSLFAFFKQYSVLKYLFSSYFQLLKIWLLFIIVATIYILHCIFFLCPDYFCSYSMNKNIKFLLIFLTFLIFTYFYFDVYTMLLHRLVQWNKYFVVEVFCGWLMLCFMFIHWTNQIKSVHDKWRSQSKVCIWNNIKMKHIAGCNSIQGFLFLAKFTSLPIDMV